MVCVCLGGCLFYGEAMCKAQVSQLEGTFSLEGAWARVRHCRVRIFSLLVAKTKQTQQGPVSGGFPFHIPAGTTGRALPKEVSLSQSWSKNAQCIPETQGLPSTS